MKTRFMSNAFHDRADPTIGADFGATHVPGHLNDELLIAQINDRAKRFRIVPPISKELACGDVGVGAMAEVPEIVAAVQAMLESSV